MKKIILLLTFSSIFSSNLICQDSLTLNNQEVKLVSIISLKRTSLQYYNLPINFDSIRTEPLTLSVDSVRRISTTLNPFYGDRKIFIMTTNKVTIKGQLIGVEDESVKLVGSVQNSELNTVYKYDAESIKKVIIIKLNTVLLSASIGAIAFGILGTTGPKEYKEYSKTPAEADFENLMNAITFNWSAPGAVPVYTTVQRNKVKDALLGAVTGAAIGALCGAIFSRNKIRVNSKYSKLEKGLVRHKKRYPKWRDKVFIRGN